jgi:hypothetical protein
MVGTARRFHRLKTTILAQDGHQFQISSFIPADALRLST